MCTGSSQVQIKLRSIKWPFTLYILNFNQYFFGATEKQTSMRWGGWNYYFLCSLCKHKTAVRIRVTLMRIRIRSRLIFFLQIEPPAFQFDADLDPGAAFHFDLDLVPAFFYFDPNPDPQQ
jgi:hypothetical protein